MTLPAPVLGTDTAFLADYVEAGVLEHTDVHVAEAISRASAGTDADVLLAAALAVRAVRKSHVCLDLATVPASIVLDGDSGIVNGSAEEGDATGDGTADDADAAARITLLPWLDPDRWLQHLSGSAVVAVVADGSSDPDAGIVDGVLRPLVLDGTRLYLERYWRFECAVATELHARATVDDDAPAPSAALLDELFPPVPGAPTDEVDLQRLAAERALRRNLAVVAGGPGTGKTRTIARMLAAMLQTAHAQGRHLQVALAAPTGKAAARMTEAVRNEIAHTDLDTDLVALLEAQQATTIDRLLGGYSPNFRHDRRNPLAADVVVVDEASMVALPLMARLLDAVRPAATVVLVGDPYQLASIEAGVVLGDIVGGALSDGATGALADGVVVLERVHRFGADSTIAALADAIRTGDTDAVFSLLRSDASDVAWVQPSDDAAVAALESDVFANATAVISAALAGDGTAGLAAANDTKVLSATRAGPFGTQHWRDRIEAHLARTEARMRIGTRWYTGRPVIVTRNDPLNNLVNGDTGLVVAVDDGAAVAFAAAGHDSEAGPGTRLLRPSQLGASETWWSMTIHKSQGSEYRHTVVSLPHAASPILTRELLYTAVTRAKQKVTVVGDEEAIRTAIERPVARSSGLRDRLRDG